jgi:DNA processing protein
LARALARADPAAERAAAAEAGIQVDYGGGPGYPSALGELADPPPVVYRRGELLDCDRQAVAIVGSRRATPYGLRMARTLAGDLARAGVTIVSGLARGIDAAAHEAALAAGGRTVAVLGSGLLEPYPPEHADLAERVAACGVVVSEFPLHAPPRRPNFPRRNRVVAALSLAVLVVEAAARSGVHSTVGHALDLGRVVLAVPGPIDCETGRGTLRLLQEGAGPVGSAHDVFAALDWCAPPGLDLPPEERRVLAALQEHAATAEDVAEATAAPVEVAAGLLVALEVRGLVERAEGGRYVAV